MNHLCGCGLDLMVFGEFNSIAWVIFFPGWCYYGNGFKKLCYSK